MIRALVLWILTLQRNVPLHPYRRTEIGEIRDDWSETVGFQLCQKKKKWNKWGTANNARCFCRGATFTCKALNTKGFCSSQGKGWKRNEWKLVRLQKLCPCRNGAGVQCHWSERRECSISFSCTASMDAGTAAAKSPGEHSPVRQDWFSSSSGTREHWSRPKQEQTCSALTVLWSWWVSNKIISNSGLR